jgi:hypothetical protein
MTTPDLSKVADVRRALESKPLVREVDQIPRGHVRIETGLVYPDGTSVEVFLVEDPTTPLLRGRKLSDLGQTMAWLLTVNIKPWLSKKRRAFLDDVLRLYGAGLNGGALELNLQPSDPLPDAVLRLSQACVRASDLIFTRRASLQSTFAEEVEEALADADLSYEQNVELVGRYARPVRVDFLVTGRNTRSAVLTLASGDASQAHIAANEVFRRFYDVALIQPEQRLTIYDDSKPVYREDDLVRLAEVSQVFAASDKQTYLDVLAA